MTDNKDTSTANSVTKGANITKVNSSAELPMFVGSSNLDNDSDNDNGVDLDDLFRDCYFGDFAGSVDTDGIGSEVPPAPAPLVSNSAFYSGRPPTNSVAAKAIAESNAMAKRKAEAALESDDDEPKESADGTSSKNLTDQQKIERRERNRKHAKRSRLRKKFLLESLQDQISGLQSEIDALKDIIIREIPDKAAELFEGISGPKGKFTPLPMPSGFGPVKTLMEPDFRLMSALSGSQQNFAISDPSLPDNPIVYVSQGFLELTGYKLDQVLGRNCRFLQGPGTDQSAVDIIRKGVREGVDTSVCLLNYKADGTPFWNQFFVAALRDAENNVVNFVGVQCEVSKAVVEKQIASKKAAAMNAQLES
jgi:PAS domain S-box-containing protein